MDIKKIASSRAADKLRKKSGNLLFSLLRLAFLLIVGYIVLYPLLYMIVAAIKTQTAHMDVTHQWVPTETTTEHFEKMWEVMTFPVALEQTALLQMVSAAMEIVVCSFIAYGFARFKFRGKGIATFLLILSLLVPVEMYSLGLAVNYRILGIFDTPFAYWLPAVFGVGIRSGMLIYIYQQFFIGLPHELEDAAYVDGAGPIRTYLSIALPSSSVVIVTVSVLAIIWYWNENYLAELCFMNENRPLAVIAGNMEQQMKIFNVAFGPLQPARLSAGCLLFMAIPLIFYMIIQRKFVKSIDRVGITG